ncbi:MAG: 16S rRNA (adenine(1518)-N(6)/adenine(1519)-N(6))-dimethyltransferase RsmA [Clostridia bacterium]|nr:16S rRNA (adenine(1518)-N(6)/adenine(1519)-N(6))-dimethyltransferase RsmA [Clostridia bacterium]
MNALTDIKYVKTLLGEAGFTFSKQLGQNFLVNPSVCPKMADMCGCEGIGVIEIGTGVGVLTTELAKRAKRVVAIELDERLRPVLDVTLKDYDNVTVIFGDVLKIDLEKVLSDYFDGMEVCVCANLPYYITSPIVMSLLESKLPFKAITVMVQKEAAQRLCADMGTRKCGAVTAAVSYYAKAEKLFSVERGSFIPSPNVDSAVIRLTVHRNPPVAANDEKMLFSVIRAAFSQRRKTLPNSIASGTPFTKEQIASALERCSIKPTARAEELTLSQFADISNTLAEV